jgi:hypothetical protein
VEFRGLHAGDVAQALTTRTLGAASSGALLRSARIDLGVAALVLGFVAIAVRWRVFGNPVVQIDEQFYLLLGGRMLHGAVPYIDIWDRKPIGLFLLYEGFRALGGSGVLTYQIGALVSVWATALILFAMGRRIAPPGGALATSILYLLWLNLAGGEAGQAPVFYNLPVAAGIALLLFRRHLADERGGDLRRTGAAVMLLFGVALQIKYSAVFEGIFAGLALLWISWRGGRPLPRLAVDAALWIGIALLPTLIVAAVYAWMGHLADWWFANATSILLRGSEAPHVVATRIRVMAMLVGPLALCVPLRRWLGARPEEESARDDLRFLDAWAAAALLGVILFGTWFNHYALPLFAPFAVIAAPLWQRRTGQAWLLLVMLVGFVIGQRALWRHTITRGTAATLAHAAEAARGGHGCLFVYDGYPALYDVTNSCLLTTRPFPAHLQARNETGATGIDQVAEVTRIMALRPDRVMAMEPAYDGEMPGPRAVVYRALRADYQELYRYTGSTHQLVVYGRKGTVRDRAPVIDDANRLFF